jgi:predicted peptidase
MNKFLHFLLAGGTGLLASCSSMKPEAAAPDRPAIKNLSAQNFSATIHANYLLFLPRNYSNAGAERWPLILFLHGAGERGKDVWKAAFHGPTKYIEKHPDFPFIVVIPQCPARRVWSHEVVLGLLDQITAQYAVDTNRIYLTGLSMGGYGAWSLATAYPERFAAVAPICGGEGNIGVLLAGADRDKGVALKSLGFWAFHGAKDNVVPVSESQRMVDILEKFGVKDVKLTIYPEAQHNSWTETYDNPALYEWFLQHERKPVTR